MPRVRPTWRHRCGGSGTNGRRRDSGRRRGDRSSRCSRAPGPRRAGTADRASTPAAAPGPNSGIADLSLWRQSRTPPSPELSLCLVFQPIHHMMRPTHGPDIVKSWDRGAPADNGITTLAPATANAAITGPLTTGGLRRPPATENATDGAPVDGDGVVAKLRRHRRRCPSGAPPAAREVRSCP